MSHDVEADALTADLKPPPPADCPTWHRPRDAKLRCWKCHDRPCVKCRRPTGSAFIQLCVACGANDFTVADAPGLPPDPPKRWVLVFAAKSGTVPMSVRMRKLIKSWCRYLGLDCVGLQNELPDGTRTDCPLEADDS